MENQQSETSDLVLTRVLDAPRELVFKVWTDPEHFGKWWGPKGVVFNLVKMDVQPGGVYFGSFTAPDGQSMWGKFVYEEVTPPEKLVYISSFCDENGNTVRAPFNEHWPLEILNILTLTENNGQTTLNLQGGPINATAEERAAFQGMIPSMQQGFGGTFEQLTAYLDSLK